MGRRGGKDRNAQKSQSDQWLRDMGHPVYWQSRDLNSQIIDMYRRRIVSLALTRFAWINLPPTCDERKLEMTLLFQGVATIAFPQTMPGSFFSTEVSQAAEYNIYDNPPSWHSFGRNGWDFTVTPDNGVLVWDNIQRMPLMPTLELYAAELADVWRTKSINRQLQKTPYILTGPESKRLDMANIYKQIAGNEPAIIADSGIEAVKIDAISTGVPYLGNELQQEMMNVWADVYALLGISSLPFKSERTIEDEVRDHSEPSELARLDPLMTRREACARLNARFADYLTDGPIDVVWRRDWHSDNYDTRSNLDGIIEIELGGDA
jgi:hypothetical protein